MSTHTPGPWIVDGRNGDILTANKDRCVASTQNGGLFNVCDALLIAAAPDLLEACKATWRFLNEEPTARTLQQQMEITATIRAALTKATGETQP